MYTDNKKDKTKMSTFTFLKCEILSLSMFVYTYLIKVHCDIIISEKQLL